MSKKKNDDSNTISLPQTSWGIAALVIIVDQLTKIVVSFAFPQIIIKNTGTAFGFFAQRNSVLLVLSIAVVGGLIVYLVRTRHLNTHNRLFIISCMLVIGGGIANIIDRILFGYVIDFIRLPLWPAFNIADLSVSVGMTLLVWQSLFKKRRTSSKTEN